MEGVYLAAILLILIGIIVLRAKRGGKPGERSAVRTIVGWLLIVCGVLILLSALFTWTGILAFLAGFLDVLATICVWIGSAGNWLAELFASGAEHIRNISL